LAIEHDRTAPVRLPAIICIPSTDTAFLAAVMAVIASSESISLVDLQARVSRVYPAVVVRRRDLSGEFGHTWYAYRDGLFVPASGPGSWPSEPGTAWARIDPASGEILDANDALVALLADPGDTISGSFVTDFIVPGTGDISSGQRRAVSEAGETRSVGLARRRDGREVMLEYVARVVDGLIEAWYREIALAAIPPPGRSQE
jgi:PAS domain-containing protein